MTPTLSILTPAIWPRVQLAQSLADAISQQCRTIGLDHGMVEHLVLLDSRGMSVGQKRQALVDAARGDYIAFVDDDDSVSDDYVSRMLGAIVRGMDCVTFRQCAIIDGKVGHIEFKAGTMTDAPWAEGETVQRPPWHVCAWRRSLVAGCLFPDSSYGEDLAWCLQARQRIRTATHVNACLHTYRHSRETTAAPPP